MDAVLTAMVEDKIGPGEQGRLFIQTAKERLAFDYALPMRSPVTALHLALKAINVTEGQGVLLSALSPRYYLTVINDLRLIPVFCDVSRDNPCMTCDTIEKALAEKGAGLEVRCIILHHTLGFLPDTAAVSQLGLPVIEDISQSFGTFRFQDKTDEDSSDSAQTEIETEADKCSLPLGNFCIMGLEEKDILTCGGGALLFSMNKRDSAALKNFSSIPNEYLMPDINAALGVVQLKELLRSIKKRKEIARVYTRASMNVRHKRFIPLEEGMYNNYAFPLVLETGLKEVAAYARKKEIVIESAFEQTLAGAGLCGPEQCPVSHSLSLRTVLFPLYPRLRSQEVERVSRLIMTLP